MFYDYFCHKCGHTEEKSHGMKEEPIFECPKCKTIMKKSINGGCGFILNGVGWASKNTATAPKIKHAYVHDLVGTKIAKEAFRPR